MAAIARSPWSTGASELARNANDGRPPNGARSCSATRSTSGGTISRRLVSRKAPDASTSSRERPTSSSKGCRPDASLATTDGCVGGPTGSDATAKMALATSPRRRICCAVKSDATTSGPVTCVGRRANCPSPSRGRIWLTRNRFPVESGMRRPSGLSEGTAERFGIRSTIASPTRTPSDSASTALIATV